MSLPNLRIVDFSYGHCGSTHDATAWEQTWTAKHHDELLEEDEFIWADSAYPARLTSSFYNMIGLLTCTIDRFLAGSPIQEA